MKALGGAAGQNRSDDAQQNGEKNSQNAAGEGYVAQNSSAFKEDNAFFGGNGFGGAAQRGTVGAAGHGTVGAAQRGTVGAAQRVNSAAQRGNGVNGGFKKNADGKPLSPSENANADEGHANVLASVIERHEQISARIKRNH